MMSMVMLRNMVTPGGGDHCVIQKLLGDTSCEQVLHQGGKKLKLVIKQHFKSFYWEQLIQICVTIVLFENRLSK